MNSAPDRAPSGLENIRQIYNFNVVSFASVNSIFSNLSMSLTNDIRMNPELSDNENDPALGDIDHYVTCLVVEWPWIASLAALVFFGPAFLLLLVVTTAKSDYLFGKHHHSYGSSADHLAMNRRAKGTRRRNNARLRLWNRWQKLPRWFSRRNPPIVYE
ncbi:hypothetical protein F5Y19DRAFT_487715 [Xylariaceae sp. FL1651]|nr:hypothetical protein F5Y19DRAFT_487715 [Xylariaceae sp. FL1651]